VTGSREAFWSSSGGAQPGRRRALWREQGELWMDGGAAPAAAGAADEDEITPAEPASSSSFVQLPADLVIDRPRILPTRASYASRGNAVRVVEIAKFLQVNRAVDGLDLSGARFELPARTFMARLNLWKGAPVGTPFVTGC
jgi:hypothetical protein